MPSESLNLKRLLIFYPDETMVESNGWPRAETLPVGTWAFVMNKPSEWDAGVSRWSQVVQYTNPKTIEWQYYTVEASELIHLTKRMKMLALVMP